MKVLIIGLGSIGQRHVRNLRTLLGDRVEILAFRTRGLTRVLSDHLQVEADDGLHERYDVRVFTDLDEALATQPTAAFICNPSSFHMPASLRAAAAGCNLFIEKPLSHSLDGVDGLLACVAAKSLVASVGYQLRFHPCLLRVRELLRQNSIGRVLAVQAQVGEYLPNWHTYEDYRHAYSARRELGGGALLSHIHEMDYLYWFFGLPKRVFAVGGHLSSLEIDVEDVASTLMEFEIDGHTVPVHLQQDFVQRRPTRNCHITGDAGTIEMDIVAATVSVLDAKGAPARAYEFAEWDRNRMFLDELTHFLECVRGERAPAVSVPDGAASLRMALAARQSLVTREIVELL